MYYIYSMKLHDTSTIPIVHDTNKLSHNQVVFSAQKRPQCELSDLLPLRVSVTKIIAVKCFRRLTTGVSFWQLSGRPGLLSLNAPSFHPFTRSIVPILSTISLIHGNGYNCSALINIAGGGLAPCLLLFVFSK